MDRLEAMSILLSVAQAGSLSGAARQLHKPLATVSRKIADLEKHLGARLLIRTTRRMTLTDSGQAYVNACRRILDEVQQAEQAVAGEFSEPRGELVITAPVVFGRICVLPVLTQFLQAYEQINARLLLADRVVHLMDDHVDVAVRIGQLPDSSLTATPIGQVRQTICASPDYLAREGVPDRPAELATFPCIGIDNASGIMEWRFDGGRKPITVAPNYRLSVSTVEAARDAAIAGLGLARLLSYQAARPCRAGELQVVLSGFEPPPLPVSLVYSVQSAREFMPIKLRAFLDFARPKLSAQLGALALPA
ncbi:MAG: LysR family transcriptional regulator [Burkholderiaceae bacterium]